MLQVPGGGAPDPAFSRDHSNLVRTSRYNVATFLPIFLLLYFSRVAYLYFLIQAGLAWWKQISPFSGVGPTTALVSPLA